MDNSHIVELIRAAIDRTEDISVAFARSRTETYYTGRDICEARREALDAVELALVGGSTVWLEILAKKPIPGPESLGKCDDCGAWGSVGEGKCAVCGRSE